MAESRTELQLAPGQTATVAGPVRVEFLRLWRQGSWEVCGVATAAPGQPLTITGVEGSRYFVVR